jgi:hypothetical protein
MPLMHVMVVYTMSMMNLFTFAKARPAQMIFITTSIHVVVVIPVMPTTDSLAHYYCISMTSLWHHFLSDLNLLCMSHMERVKTCVCSFVRAERSLCVPVNPVASSIWFHWKKKKNFIRVIHDRMNRAKDLWCSSAVSNWLLSTQTWMDVKASVKFYNYWTIMYVHSLR